MPRGDILTVREAEIYKEARNEGTIRETVLHMRRNRNFILLPLLVRRLYDNAAAAVPYNRRDQVWKRISTRFGSLRKKFP